MPKDKKISMPSLIRSDESAGSAGEGSFTASRSRSITITMSYSAFCITAIAAVFVCVWIFIMGVILGNGYFPEEKIASLGTIMPQSMQQTPLIIASDEDTLPQNSRSAGLIPLEPIEEEDEEIVILPEELEYQENLKPKPRIVEERVQTRRKLRQDSISNAQIATSLLPPVTVVNSESEMRTAQSTLSPDTKVDSQPTDIRAQQVQRKVHDNKPVKKQKEKPAAAQIQDKKKPGQKQQSKKQEKKADKKSQAKKEVFQYVFQVASFKDRSQAQALSKKLTRSGLKTRVERSSEKGGTWHVVTVSFTGRPDDVASLRSKLAQHNVHSLIRKSKKPVVR